MAAVRMFFSWLTEKGVLAMNPAREVKTPRFSRKHGKTPAFARDEVRTILDSIDIGHVVGQRDKALLATLAYACSRISAAVSLKVRDYFQNGRRSVIRLRTKGGKEKEFPVHHLLEEVLDAYLDNSGLRANPAGPLFPTTVGKTRKLGTQPMTRIDAARMLKRRLANAGIVGNYSPHSFRATGLTRFLEEGGTLEGAQNIADHADSRTTKLYDRRQQSVLREDVERIRY
jgi:integrase/recombinase XerD